MPGVVGDLKRSAAPLIIFQGCEHRELYDLLNYSYALHVRQLYGEAQMQPCNDHIRNYRDSELIPGRRPSFEHRMRTDFGKRL